MITHSLKVLLWGKEIGRLSWDKRRNISYFEYNQAYLDGTLDAFPLIAPIRSPASRRPIQGDNDRALYHRLPPFLADSLPDAWGNQVFECWRLEHGIRNQEITPLDILSFIGRRGMGALEFLPESGGIRVSERINLEALTSLAQRIFAERERVRILPEDSLTMQSLMAVGTSAGGRQPKAIIAVNPETGEICSGQISGRKGFEYCILKFGDPERSSAELEMAYYEMATAAGIQMMSSRLIEAEGRRHFVTLRFDRDKDRKLHMQTLAAICPEADSYEQLLLVCRRMRLPETAQEEIFRRMVFNFLANNTDDHNKNFSFLMDQKGNWRLSPAYDMTYIFNTAGYLPETMHCLMLRGKTSRWTKEDAMAMAKENGIRRAEAIIAEVAEVIRKFRQFGEKHHVQERWIGAIERTLLDNMAAWQLANPQHEMSSWLEGHKLSHIRLEPTYKGHFHLRANIDGNERKYVIAKNKGEYAFIDRVGVTNVPHDFLTAMVRKYFFGQSTSDGCEEHVLR